MQDHSVLSINAEDAPIIHISHIQKQAPGPPRHIAVDTPMMFPVPTLEAVETSIACREETEPFFSEGSRRILKDSVNNLICTPLVLIVKYNPAAAMTIIRIGKYMTLSISFRIKTISSITTPINSPN